MASLNPSTEVSNKVVISVRKSARSIDQLLDDNKELYAKFENYLVEFDLPAVAYKYLFVGCLFALSQVDDNDLPTLITLATIKDKLLELAKKQNPDIMLVTAFDTFHFPNISKLGSNG